MYNASKAALLVLQKHSEGWLRHNHRGSVYVLLLYPHQKHIRPAQLERSSVHNILKNELELFWWIVSLQQGPNIPIISIHPSPKINTIAPYLKSMTPWQVCHLVHDLPTSNDQPTKYACSCPSGHIHFSLRNQRKKAQFYEESKKLIFWICSIPKFNWSFLAQDPSSHQQSLGCCCNISVSCQGLIK